MVNPKLELKVNYQRSVLMENSLDEFPHVLNVEEES